MKIISILLTRYVQFCEKRKIIAKERRKKYYLNKYGVYCNADKLTYEEMLQSFWRILKIDYDIYNFTSNTSLSELLSPGDYDCEDATFISDIERIFGFVRGEIFKEEPFNNFGELAAIVIKKAKEKKQQQKKSIKETTRTNACSNSKKNPHYWFKSDKQC